MEGNRKSMAFSASMKRPKDTAGSKKTKGYNRLPEDEEKTLNFNGPAETIGLVGTGSYTGAVGGHDQKKHIPKHHIYA